MQQANFEQFCDEKNYIERLQNEVKFLRNMTLTTKDIQNDEIYKQQFFHDYDQIYDLGGLTKIRKEYYPVFSDMLREIDKYINTINLVRKGNEMSVIALKKILENEDIFERFLKADNTTTYLNVPTKKTLFRAVQRRVLNSRAKAILKRYQERNTGHYTKHGTDTSLREELKVKVKNASVAIVANEIRSPELPVNNILVKRDLQIDENILDSKYED